MSLPCEAAPIASGIRKMEPLSPLPVAMATPQRVGRLSVMSARKSILAGATPSKDLSTLEKDLQEVSAQFLEVEKILSSNPRRRSSMHPRVPPSPSMAPLNALAEENYHPNTLFSVVTP
jgi:hypothetical protein